MSTTVDHKTSESSEDISNFLVLYCPHCGGCVIMHTSDLNCRIARHGFDLNAHQQIPPHATKEYCDELVKNGSVLGCTRPFRVEGDGAAAVAVECDYI